MIDSSEKQTDKKKKTVNVKNKVDLGGGGEWIKSRSTVLNSLRINKIYFKV